MQNNQPLPANEVRADATKDFFLYMLVRDITLDDAVIDLVDNSVDAARAKLRATKENSKISLQLSNDRFLIEDDCGGFSKERARQYVFRFGRDETLPDYQAASLTIGQFGVGLKRAIFKMGELGFVRSITQGEAFEVQIDVNKWRKDKATPWFFPLEDRNVNGSAPGTAVEIKKLFPTIKEQFANSDLLDELKDKIRRAHYSALNEGIVIDFNSKPIERFNLEMIASKEIKPLKKTVNLSNDVRLEITAGIAESDPQEAGWYVFCNERMVLAADQTSVTGWGETSIEGRSPQYHNQFARFRGVARFLSLDARQLPWNTTKRGVDASSPVYQKGRAQMVEALKSVVRFLNSLDKELESNERPLRDMVQGLEEKSRFTAFEKVADSPRFTFPATERSPRTTTNLCYSAPLEMVGKLKEELEISRNDDVAKFCFDYTYDRVVGK